MIKIGHELRSGKLKNFNVNKIWSNFLKDVEINHHTYEALQNNYQRNND
jgi:hypothetical protein